MVHHALLNMSRRHWFCGEDADEQGVIGFTWFPVLGPDFLDVLAKFFHCRCPHRHGAHGVSSVNMKASGLDIHILDGQAGEFGGVKVRVLEEFLQN